MAKARILVLEDDDSFRQFLCEALSMVDYDATPVASAPEAIASATRAKFDLIVSDVRMAGMDGLDCLAALRTVQPDMRRIVITGYASDDAPSRAIAVQAEDYLYKPFGLKEFVDAVSRVLESGRERSRYVQLLEGYKKLFSRDPSVEWESIDARRDLTFQSLFVGVRSHKLTEPEALGVWDHLEAQDAVRERLKAERPSRQAVQTLVDGYQYAIDLCAALVRTSLYVPARRPAGSVPPAIFAKLYQRIRDGEITLEQIKLAPFMRSLGPTVFQASRELDGLYVKIWDEAPPG